MLASAAAPAALRIWHVAFPVADIDRSLAFYCAGLGFGLVGRDADTAFVALEPGGFTIELLLQPRAESAADHRAPDHFAFETADLDAFHARVAAAGLAVPPIHVMGEGLKRFALDDPDGVRLDFFQGRDALEAEIAAPGQA